MSAGAVHDAPRRGWALHALGVTLLAAATWGVFSPSMGHVPRWDHWWFLHDASRHEGFGELVRRYHSYNRSRVHGRGDFGLYRPVLFALLCAEQAAFGTDFAAWQRAGLVLHLGFVLLVLAAMLRVRRAVDPSAPAFCPLAYGLCLFFAVNVSACEMVYWCHINGYILFAALCLAAMRVAWPWLTRGEAARPAARLAAAWGLVALAAFTHEVGQFFAALFGLALAAAACRAGRPARAALLLGGFAAVLPLYQAVNAYDYALRMGGQPLYESPGRLLAFAWENPGATAYNGWRYALFTLVQPFFPTCVQWSSFGRVVLSEPAQEPGPYLRPGPMALIGYATLGLLLAVAARGAAALRRPGPGQLLPWLALPVGLAVLQAGMNVLGRLNLRPGPGVLTSSSYYAYLPLACLLLVVYALWQAARAHGRAGWRTEAVALLGLLPVAAASAWQTHAVGLELKKEARLVRAYTRDIRRLVQAHRHDPAFRFSFGPDALAALPRFGRQDPKPFPEILFPRRVDHLRPTHVFVREGGGLRALTAAEYRRDDAAPRANPP